MARFEGAVESDASASFDGSARGDRTYSIRQLCREFGATARALRFYEDKGLLDPIRRGNARVYSSRDRARLKLILRGRRIGFSLTEIQEMIDLYDRKEQNLHQMAVALPRHRARVEVLKQQLEDIMGTIEMAEESCQWMENTLAEHRPDLLSGAEDSQLVRKRPFLERRGEQPSSEFVARVWGIRNKV